MLSAEQLKEGLKYATDNFKNDSAPHLHVDKRVIKKLLNLNGKRVLDFGCGMGGMTLWYANNWDCEVYGLDIDANHIEVATALKERNKEQNVHFEQRNILESPLGSELKFDNIFMNDVVEHINLPTLAQLFQNLHSVLRTDGRIFVSYPPWKSPHASHVSHAVGLPWCQFLPDSMLKPMILKNNIQILGDLEPDLLSAYESLNKLEHRKFKNILNENNWKIEFRKSYSLLNKLPGLSNLNIRFFPFNYLITKEFLILKKN